MRTRDIGRAWAAVSSFLRSCTDADPDAPDGLDLVLFEESVDEPFYRSSRFLASMEGRFGEVKRRQWLSGVREEYCYQWRLADKQLGEAVTFLREHQPWPKYYIGPVQLKLSYDFRWVDPDSGVVLEGQAAELRTHSIQALSNLLVFLEPQSAAILTARFPFEQPNPGFVSYLARVSPLLPIRLLPKHLRAWIPSKRLRPTGYTVRKLDPALIAELETVTQT